MADLSGELLSWYDQNAREMPWRTAPSMRKNGVTPDPYHIWMSEIMLQQTTVAAVKEYFLKFTTRWPSVMILQMPLTKTLWPLGPGLDIMRAPETC